jgi:putative polyhydroxyalkanoate system protein
MTNINIKHHHHLGKQAAKKKVEKIATVLQEKLNVKYHWEDDALCFKRSGASGKIDVTDDQVELKVKLGLMFAPMKGTIEKSIQENIVAELGDDIDSDSKKIT